MKLPPAHLETLPPQVGYPLAAAMVDNQKLLTKAEERVSGDIERACDLVELEDCHEPEPRPGEERMAALAILLASQKEWFGETNPSSEDPEDYVPSGYTLANVTTNGLLLIRRQTEKQQKRVDERVTLLEATAGSDRQVRVSKVVYDVFKHIEPTHRPITKADWEIMRDTNSRLLRVNRKWRQLLKEHPFKSAPPHSRVPFPRVPSS